MLAAARRARRWKYIYQSAVQKRHPRLPWGVSLFFLWLPALSLVCFSRIPLAFDNSLVVHSHNVWAITITPGVPDAELRPILTEINPQLIRATIERFGTRQAPSRSDRYNPSHRRLA
ncbi:hypothetical protein BJV78DRAFT_552916 [Lactifluus subvellereus]|nr:hypothetical protein BJV78DRAFT_552916 [Lactifluus subvellereus]